jgi:hypothetical protein
MYDYTTGPGFVLLPALFFAVPTFFASAGQRLVRGWQRLAQIIRDDWRSTRALSYGGILLLITTAVVTAYYLNNPQPALYPDSFGYFQISHTMLTQGKFVDVLRTPVYPMFIAFVFLIAGAANMEAISVAQAILFVLATLELYILTLLLFRRAWIALGGGLLLGTNLYVISIVKPILSESLGLWLVTSLALLIVLFFQRWQTRYLWLVALCTLVLFMTRPEWIYLPVPLFAYLLFIAWRHGKLRRFLPHSLVALALLYVVLGLYVYENGVQNGFTGVTDNQYGNLLGKVLQYHMQDEAPPEYAQVQAIVNAYVKQGGTDPNWLVQHIYPALGANHWALAGAYSQAIVIHHPLEFLLDTIPVFFSSLTERSLYSHISDQGPLASPLLLLQRASGDLYLSYALFPLFALFWVILFCSRRTARLPLVEGMGAVVLVGLYGLTLTSLGGFVEYTRLHVPFDSLLLLAIWGSALASYPYLMSFVARWHVRWRVVWLVVGTLLAGAIVVSMARSLLARGLKEAFNPQTWMVEHLIVNHKLLTLAGLAVVGLLVWLTFRSRRSAHRSTPEAKQPEHARLSEP